MMKAMGLEKSMVMASGSPVPVLFLDESLAGSREILEELQAAGMIIDSTVVTDRREFLEAIRAQDSH
jgi:hypothetical protein